MIRPEDVTDAMVEVLHEKYDIAGRIGTPTKVAARIAIAAAINASGCVLVPKRNTEMVIGRKDLIDAAYLLRELANMDTDGENIIPVDQRDEDALRLADHLLYGSDFWPWSTNAPATDPREQALDRMAEDAREKGLYDEDKEKGDE